MIHTVFGLTFNTIIPYCSICKSNANVLSHVLLILYYL